MKPVSILAMCGSVREGSTNLALLHAAKLCAPTEVDIIVWNEQSRLPHFNPGLETSPPTTVQDFRNLVARVDGLIVACPEYARGVPGSFKNALDWLVGGDSFVNKKFTLWNASPRAFEAQRSLKLVLETMSGIFVETAALNIPLLKQEISAEDITRQAEWADQIKMALDQFVSVLRQ